MFLSESYKTRLKNLAGIISESEKELEFQIRDIGGSVFYMRNKGDKVWRFISSEEFAKNCHKGKLLKWKQS